MQPDLYESKSRRSLIGSGLGTKHYVGGSRHDHHINVDVHVDTHGHRGKHHGYYVNRCKPYKYYPKYHSYYRPYKHRGWGIDVNIGGVHFGYHKNRYRYTPRCYDYGSYYPYGARSFGYSYDRYPYRSLIYSTPRCGWRYDSPVDFSTYDVPLFYPDDGWTLSGYDYGNDYLHYGSYDYSPAPYCATSSYGYDWPTIEWYDPFPSYADIGYGYKGQTVCY